MGYTDITKGDKTGKALGARLIKSKGGTAGIEVAFEFEEPSTGSMERLNWVGWLSEKAKSYTMDTLVNVLDSDGVEAMDHDGVFTSQNFVNTEKEVKLVVDLEEGKDSDGNPKVDEHGAVKMYPRIQFVNNLGGSAYAGCTPDVGRGILAETGFRAAFLAMRKESGKPTVAPTPQPQTNGAAPQTPPPNLAPQSGAAPRKVPF